MTPFIVSLYVQGAPSVDPGSPVNTKPFKARCTNWAARLAETPLRTIALTSSGFSLVLQRIVESAVSARLAAQEQVNWRFSQEPNRLIMRSQRSRGACGPSRRGLRKHFS